MTDMDMPAVHSRWEPADRDWASQPSGKALQGEDGSIIPLSNGQLAGLTVDLAESAAYTAELALARRDAHDAGTSDQTGDLDLSNATGEHGEDTADSALLARWDAEQ